jgi:hypothetical protein
VKEPILRVLSHHQRLGQRSTERNRWSWKKPVAAALLGTSLATVGVVGASPASAAADTCMAYGQHEYNDYPGWPLPPDRWYRWETPVKAAGGLNIFCTLRPGDRGAPVLILQRTLNNCYGQGLVRDAVYGPATQHAVLNVQTFENNFHGAGLNANGVFEGATSASMSWYGYRTQTDRWGCFRGFHLR